MVASGCSKNAENRKWHEIVIGSQICKIDQNESLSPVDLGRVELIGCSENERVALGHCLGQIRGAQLDVRTINVSWPERPVAARVAIGTRCFVYLVKDSKGKWQVHSSINFDP